MQSEESKNWFQQFTNHLGDEPKLSADEIAQRQCERQAAAEALEGTSKESAYMKDDRSVAVKYWTYKDGVIGDGWDLVLPEDAHYQELCSKHNLKHPGDESTIAMRWLNGQWINDDNQLGTGTARTA